MPTVADIMQRDVITVPATASVRELVELLSDESVSGVPVLDSARKVTGVVSQTDVIRLSALELEEAPEGPLAGRSPTDFEGATETTTEDERFDVGNEEEWPEAFFVAPDEWGFLPAPTVEAVSGATLDDHTVADIMTPLAYAVSPSMSLGELARFMVEGHIHRALVVNEGDLVGIVTTFDVLRAVAREEGA